MNPRPIRWMGPTPTNHTIPEGICSLETVDTKHAHNPDKRGLAGTQRKTHRMLREVGRGHGETGVLEAKKDWV